MASGLIWDEEGNDITMDALTAAVELMGDDDVPRAPLCPMCGGEVSHAIAGIGDSPLSDITWPSCTVCDWEGVP